MGAAAHLIETEDGGQVFIHGLLTHVWEPGDEVSRRFAAVNLNMLRAATAADIATAFGISPATLWQWKSAASIQGMAGLISEKRGPKGNSKLTDELIVIIHRLKAQGLSNRATAEQAGISEFSVRRAMTLDPATGEPTKETAPAQATTAQATTATAVPTLASDPTAQDAEMPVQEELPILATPTPRAAERAAVTTRASTAAVPAFTPTAHAAHAGLLLALPALEATGLLDCVQHTYGEVAAGFYSLTTMILESVLRTLAGEPRA